MSHWQVWLYLAAVLIPLGAFALQFVLIRVLKRANALIATAAIAASLALSLVGLVSYQASAPEAPGGHAATLEAAAGHEAASAHALPPPAPREWSLQYDWVVLGEGLAGPGSPALVIPMGVRIDGLAAVMFAMVSFIATLVHLYSIGYMKDDPGYPRFFAYLSLFCFSMLGLVAAPNVFQVFVFWELVGICSYLLIGFWYQEKPNADAANKAFVANRIGDAGMILGLGLLWSLLGTLDMAEINRSIRGADGRLNLVAAVDVDAHADTSDDGTATVELRDRDTGAPLIEAGTGRARRIPMWLLSIAGLGIFAGCVGKSAQFPLHVWLPDAMAGPTPVSALIHAATMVAAGVYLVGRFYPLFTPVVLLHIAYTGAITLFIGATIATVQTDYKKVLAYSTVSQLGFMMLGLGVGGWAAGLFHLVTHACFKALLFLGAGSVYHAVHTYEMPRLGGLRARMPVTAGTMLLATAAIAGVPFLSGFYSKDAILASALVFVSEPGNARHALLLVLPVAGALLTAFYMFRMWFLLFSGTSRSALAAHDAHAHSHVHDHDHDHAHGDPVAHAHESPWPMALPLIVLAVPTVAIGWPWRIVPLSGVPVLEHVLASGAPVPVHEHAMGVQVTALALSLAIAGIGIGLAALFYYWRKLDAAAAARRLAPVYDFLRHKWYFDELYAALFIRPTLSLARGCSEFDRRVIDRVVNASALSTRVVSALSSLFDRRMVDGAVAAVADVVGRAGVVARVLQTGKVRQYVMMLAAGLVVLFWGVYRWIQG